MPSQAEPLQGPAPAVPEFIETLISRLLLGGVLVSMATVAVGVVIMFAHHPQYLQGADLHRLTQPGAAFPQTPGEIALGLREGRGMAVVMLGLLLLIATPILRVAVSVIGFVIQRDWGYALISAAVLAVLVISFLLGKAG